MHQRPPADPYNKDDLLVPADIARTTTTTMDQPDRFSPADPADADYHGGGGTETDDGNGGDDGHQGPRVGRSAVDLFDDVFGSSPEDHGHGHGHEHGQAEAPHTTDRQQQRRPSTTTTATAAATHAHPSDMNRLQQDHSTAGYRDGLTAGKNASIQAGFDEGYSLGAALGTVVGELLGLLEGLVAAVPGSVSESDPEPLPALLARACQELSVPSVFGPAYFAPDGTWTYDVAAGGPAENDAAGAEPTIFDVARAHPLVRAWRGTVDALLRRLGVRWGGAGEEAALAAVLGLQEEGGDETGEAEKHTAGKAAMTASTSSRTEPSTPATGTATPTRAPPSDANALDW